MIELRNVEKIFGTTRGRFKSDGTVDAINVANVQMLSPRSNVKEILEVCA